jgi:Ca-activated chloride channel family protein
MTDAGRPTILIFLTDGLPTVGEVDVGRIIDNVQDAGPENARIFPFGVGYDVNTALLDTIAENHRGASGYVRPEEAIDEKVSAFYAKVSTPLLANLEIDFGRVDVEDVYPYPLPDLFAGTQLVVLGRYQGGGETSVTLEGEVNGQRQAFTYDDLEFHREGGEEFIARLWATRKIGYLLQQIRLHGEADELVDEIVGLSVRYGIITPYTSFLVEETDLALREGGRSQLAEEAMVQATRTVEPSGQAAVDRSVQEKALSEALAPAAPANVAGPDMGGAGSSAVSPVRYVGDKTFVLHAGVWTDTTFDPDKMEAVPLGFGSDDYFALLVDRPDWGRYFALGDHVIVVLDGIAYEVREGEAPALELPEAEPSSTPLPQMEEAPAGEEQAPSPFQALVQAILDLVDQILEAFSP